MLTVSDDTRYRALLGWLITNGVETAGLPATYPKLCDEALRRGLIRFHLLPQIETEPFALGVDFFGESLEAVLDDMLVNSNEP